MGPTTQLQSRSCIIQRVAPSCSSLLFPFFADPWARREEFYGSPSSRKTNSTFSAPPAPSARPPRFLQFTTPCCPEMEAEGSARPWVASVSMSGHFLPAASAAAATGLYPHLVLWLKGCLKYSDFGSLGRPRYRADRATQNRNISSNL